MSIERFAELFTEPNDTRSIKVTHQYRVHTLSHYIYVQGSFLTSL